MKHQTTKHLKKMENLAFKIEFNDAQGNEVYSVTKNFYTISEACKYAMQILATTSDECVDFNIVQL